MKYNFDEIVDRRHTNAMNTDGFRGYIFHDFEGKKKFENCNNKLNITS